tara:strand:- start:1295 stop:3130 length:1836 start_codon:yes stop_codon:yes gene_type:complete
MEEKQFDPYQFIGFILIAMILTWMLMRNQNSDLIENSNNQEIIKSNQSISSSNKDINKIESSPIQLSYGVFSKWLEPKEIEIVSIENEDLKVEISSKGANISLLNLKTFTNHLYEPLNLIENGNHQLNIQLKTRLGLLIQSKDIFFESEREIKNEYQAVTFIAKFSKNKFLKLKYILPNKGYKMTFKIESSGLENILIPDELELKWDKSLYRNSKSIDYESRYTQLTYAYEKDKIDDLSISGEDQDDEEQIRWVSYRQHFFSSILIPETPFRKAYFESKDLINEKSLEGKFTKRLSSSFPIYNKNGNLMSNMSFYFGPTDYRTLKSYGNSLEESVPVGWGIFGWINKYVFLPLFSWLASFFPYGISIIILTIIVRLAMSPVTYKSYVSQIKMKVLRPEIEELNKKYKNDAVKKQQETMSLYAKTGVNPLSGCIPALIQLPVFYALFSFFPVAFELRQKSFLWADDLSSYDSVLQLPFSIIFYGDHVSLFPILASAAIFVYTLMTTGQNPMPQQEGVPNMKFIIYLMPLMMLVFFNNYASGLSLYYFISNSLTIILMIVIKNFIVKEDKIRAQIDENKNKPRKAGGFSERLQKAMEAAEAQKKMNQKNKRSR